MKTVNPKDGTKHACSEPICTLTSWSVIWTKLHVHWYEVLKCGAGWWRRTSGGLTVINEVSNGAKEERNILHSIKLQKAKWIGHILHRNCLLKHIIGWKTGGTKRQARRRKQLLGACKEEKTDESERESIRSHSWELTLEDAMDQAQNWLRSERDEHSFQIQ